MKCNHPKPVRSGVVLIEALVYISVVVIVLGVGYLAMYRCIDNSKTLRRSADDIARVLHMGELWRADVRAATVVRWEGAPAARVLRLESPSVTNSYVFTASTVSRRVGTGPWVPILSEVKASSIQADKRQHVEAWQWDVELKPRSKSARVRPVFTFTAVPGSPMRKQS